jgi:hypothetical protein
VSNFFDKVSWPKVVLVLGGFVLLIASLVLFPDAFERLSHTVLEWARAFGDIFTGGTE